MTCTNGCQREVLLDTLCHVCIADNYLLYKKLLSWFILRCESGEVRSRRTKAAFTHAIEGNHFAAIQIMEKPE